VPESPQQSPDRWTDPAALRGAAVTVVTVCRNPGGLLEQAIASVAALQRHDVAHVVIDGASSDGTMAYLRATPYRLAHWQSERDTGIYDAMNKGWAVAGSDSYVLFLGADDRLVSLPSVAELSQARARGAVLIYGEATVGETPFVSRFTEEIRFGNTLHHQALLVDKGMHPEPPFDARLRIYGDWDFNLRLWRQGVRAEYLPTLRSQVGAGGLSSSQPLGETLRIVHRHSGPWQAAFLACWMAKKKLNAFVRRRSSA
jgi:glycosyltransferase involved in cell wall biosynthesis